MRRLPFASDGLSWLGALILIVLVICGALGLLTDFFGKPNALAGPALSRLPGHLSPSAAMPIRQLA